VVVGDIIVIEDNIGRVLHIGILGSYTYKPELKGIGLSHQSLVNWKTVIPVKSW
jgi:predicted Mrr-cat superfamily restriction endonuclease